MRTRSARVPVHDLGGLISMPYRDPCEGAAPSKRAVAKCLRVAAVFIVVAGFRSYGGGSRWVRL